MCIKQVRTHGACTHKTLIWLDVHYGRNLLDRPNCPFFRHHDIDVPGLCPRCTILNENKDRRSVDQSTTERRRSRAVLEEVGIAFGQEWNPRRERSVRPGSTSGQTRSARTGKTTSKGKKGKKDQVKRKCTIM